MNELKKDVDIFSKKRPTVNELKTEVIRLRKSNEKSDAGLNHYKAMYEGVCHENKELRNMSSKLNSAKNQLEANNKALSDSVEHLESKLDRANKDYEELKAKRQYNTVGFVIASLIALGAVAVIILRLV
jgi:predicted RNase H-like nuclease (RuvC/YqgF family)